MNCQEYIRYSDILDGKYEIDQLESIHRTEKYRSTSSVQTNHYKDLIQDLIQAQSRCADNINQLGYMLNQQSSKRHTQSDFSTPKLNMSQVSQISQIQTPNKPIQSTPASPQLLNQLNNDNLLDQIDKLIKIRKLDQSILLRIIRKHMNDCPYFVQLVKQEFRNSINSLQ
ncbi:unnamed protein product [Paramecium primaurelia]|uniref:Uncharacterized protein n=2 Tax=Paramecium TaxID=5884 RepID=A0A8S1WJL7_9CILI|nr:unnamed protein product [Paramecium primaurelia]CAD8189132.1 unnamed protein product [Paramecium pentaurelia]